MKALYFSGKAGSGKTATALGIGIKLQEKGLKVSYFKPLGCKKGLLKKDDSDIALMKNVFKLPFSDETISPFTISDHYLKGKFLDDQKSIIKRIDETYKTCGEGYDLILIDGSIGPHVGFNQGLDDYSLAERFNAAILPVFRTDDDYGFDQDLLHLDLWSARKTSLIGPVFNNVSQAQWNRTNTIYKVLLEKKGFSVLGVIPRRDEVSSPTVAEFYNALQGEILAAPEHMNRLVEEVVIGSMTIESALGYLRRAPNKVLVTGGDRSDIALTALETSTAAIILTGGLYPDVRVLSRAEEKGVPVILVHGDTYSTVENLHNVYRSIHPENSEAIQIVKDNIDRYFDMEKFLQYIGPAL